MPSHSRRAHTNHAGHAPGTGGPQRARLRSKTEALRKEWSEPRRSRPRGSTERLRADYERRLKRYEEREADYQQQIRRLEDEVVAQHDILDPLDLSSRILY